MVDFTHCFDNFSSQLYRQVSAWTEGSPLAYSTSGSVPPSYKTVNSSISTASRCQEDQYEEKIIDYAIEWKKLVTLKFTSEYEEVQNSKRDVEHYTKKVTGLRGNRKRSKSNGKEVGTKLSEKLERNEEKLEQASKSYDKHKRSLLHLVDELVDKSWKDLFPLMILIFEFDVNNAQERAMVLSELHDVMKDLSVAASENGISLPPNGNSATELWRTLRSEWHGAPSTSMREGPTTPAKPRERRVLKTAFEDVDIDLGKTAPTPKQETLKDASLCEDAPKNSDSEDKPKKSGDLKDMPAIKTDKTASEATSDDVMYADATSFTEQMLDEELLESSWASDEAPVGF